VNRRRACSFATENGDRFHSARAGPRSIDSGERVDNGALR
jgi:hypothetical protein